jgi:hypothetical protein
MERTGSNADTRQNPAFQFAVPVAFVFAFAAPTKTM